MHGRLVPMVIVVCGSRRNDCTRLTFRLSSTSFSLSRVFVGEEGAGNVICLFFVIRKICSFHAGKGFGA